jgi:hypothetical protein
MAEARNQPVRRVADRVSPGPSLRVPKVHPIALRVVAHGSHRARPPPRRPIPMPKSSVSASADRLMLDAYVAELLSSAPPLTPTQVGALRRAVAVPTARRVELPRGTRTLRAS